MTAAGRGREGATERPMVVRRTRRTSVRYPPQAILLDPATLKLEGAAAACPATTVALLGFDTPTVVHCGGLDDGHTDHFYGLAWSTEAPSD